MSLERKLSMLAFLPVAAIVLSAAACSEPDSGPGLYSVGQKDLAMTVEVPVSGGEQAQQVERWVKEAGGEGNFSWVRVRVENLSNEPKGLCSVEILDASGRRADLASPFALLLQAYPDNRPEIVRIYLDSWQEEPDYGELLPGETRSFLEGSRADLSDPRGVFGGGYAADGSDGFPCDEPGDLIG